jgi:L-fuconolactonase
VIHPILVDGHCHAAAHWFCPVDSLVHEMDANGVRQAVLTQVLGETNNSYLFDCCRRFPGRFSVIVWVDVRRDDAGDELIKLSEAGAAGLRLSAIDRGTGKDPLTLWRTAAGLGLPVTVRGEPTHFLASSFVALVEELPDLRIVIEHLGTCKVPHTDNAHHALQAEVFDLARFPNIYMKVSGLGEFCERAGPPYGAFPFQRPIPRLLPLAYQTFGPSRLIWGSDFPLVAAREGYSNALRLSMEEFAAIDESSVSLIFGETAQRVFPPRGRQ